MKRWTKGLVMAAVLALPLAAATISNAGDRPYYGGGPGFGFYAGYCDGSCLSIGIAQDRADVRAAFRELRRDRMYGAGWRELRADRARLRAEMRELRHDRRLMRECRLEGRHGHRGHGHGGYGPGWYGR